MTPLTADLEALPGLDGAGKVQTFVPLLSAGAEILGVAAHGVQTKRGVFIARLEIQSVSSRSFRVARGGEGRGRPAVQVRALGGARHHTARVTRAEEQRVGAADRLDALDVKRVQQGRVGPQEPVAARVVDLQAAHRHALGVLPVALKIAADVLVAAADDRRAETAKLREHLGHVDHAHLVHELAVEDFGVERGLAEGGVGAGDRIGVGRFVGVEGVRFHLERGENHGVVRPRVLGLLRGELVGIEPPVLVPVPARQGRGVGRGGRGRLRAAGFDRHEKGGGEEGRSSRPAGQGGVQVHAWRGSRFLGCSWFTGAGTTESGVKSFTSGRGGGKRWRAGRVR